MAVKSYQDLFAWQRAMDLAEETYRITVDLPVEERYGLTAQVRRAAVSVPSNIAEGHERGSTPEYVRYIRIAKGSLAEAETQVLLLVRLRLLKEDATTAWFTGASEVGRILNGLLASLRARP